MAGAHIEAEKSFEIPAFESKHLVVQARVKEGHGVDLDAVAKDCHSFTQTQSELVGHKIHLRGLGDKLARLLSLLIVVGLVVSCLEFLTGWLRVKLTFGLTPLVTRFVLTIRLLVLRLALVALKTLASFRILLLTVPAFAVGRLGSVVAVAAVSLIPSFIVAGLRIGTIVVVLLALRFATLLGTATSVVVAWFAVALVVGVTLVVVVLLHL